MPESRPLTDEPYPLPEPGLYGGMQTWDIETAFGTIEARRGYGSWHYSGSADALIAARIAEPWQVPGNPKCKRKLRFARDNLLRFGKRVRFSATRYRDGPMRIYVSLTDAQEAIEKAQAAQQKALALLPQSEDDFRQMLRMFATPMAGPEAIRTTRGGYRFPAASVERYVRAIAAAVDTLIDGQVIFDRIARAREIETIKRKTAGADVTFQAFLATAVDAVDVDDQSAPA